MFILTDDLQISNGYLLLGMVPETFAVLLLGLGLIVVALALKWAFKRREETKIESKLGEAAKR
jgi:hypothetical protein